MYCYLPSYTVDWFFLWHHENFTKQLLNNVFSILLSIRYFSCTCNLLISGASLVVSNVILCDCFESQTFAWKFCLLFIPILITLLPFIWLICLNCCYLPCINYGAELMHSFGASFSATYDSYKWLQTIVVVLHLDSCLFWMQQNWVCGRFVRYTRTQKFWCSNLICISYGQKHSVSFN